MYNIIYYIWGQEHSFPLSMILSLYSWASSHLAAIPEYAMIDTLLALWTLFHIFVAASYLAVSDAFYKEALLKLHIKIVKPWYDSPLMIPCANLAAAAMVTFLSYQAATHSDDSRATLRAVIAVNTWACAIFLQKLSKVLVKLGLEYAMKVESDIETHDIQTWKAPPAWTSCISALQDLLMRPEVHGAENIPTDQGCLYVMNHALMGLEMVPFIATIYRLKNVFLRGLSDFIHMGQAHGEFIRYFGGVVGSRENVDTLMENNHNVLVYPGGGHEIMKPCAVPNYTLMWKQRLGFARMAIKHGYPIIPCCSVGTEDMQDRWFDLDLGFIRKDLKCPVIKPILPHNLQKVYYWVGEPIPTAQYNGDWENKEYAQEVRDKVKAAVEAGIKEMQERQANDPDRYLLDHIGNIAKNMFISALGGEGSPAAKKLGAYESDEWEPIPEAKKVD